MPSIRDESTVEVKPLTAVRQHFCREYCRNGHNGAQAYKTAYPGTKSGYNKHAARLMVIDGIKQEISRIEAKTVEKMEHNRTIAIRLLNDNLVAVQVKADAGEVGAISARTAVIRELNAISNLHSATVHTPDAQVPVLEPAEADARAAAAREYKLRLSKGIA